MYIVEVLFAEIAVFICLSVLKKYISGFGLYNRVIFSSKIPVDYVISLKEKVAYHVTKIIRSMPSFSHAPAEYLFDDTLRQIRRASSRKEKVLMILYFIFLVFQSILGNILYDVILIMTVMSKQLFSFAVYIRKMIITIFSSFCYEEVYKNVHEMMKWIESNINLLLVVIIIVMACYAGGLKRKKKQYSIEEIWAEEETKRIHKVAEKQQELEDCLIDISKGIYDNLEALSEKIHFYDIENPFVAKEYVEYSTDRISEALYEITKIGGKQVYYNRNWPILSQLIILGLLPPDNRKESNIELKLLSKDLLEHCKTRQELCSSYAYGIACMNGINRVLKFSYKKKRQYRRIVSRISYVNHVDSLIEKAK